MDSLPIIGLTNANGAFDAIGVLGFYELDLNPDTMTADLTSVRTSAIGESYIVSAAGFFTITPCATCLKLVGIDVLGSGDDALIEVDWELSHPFPPGDPELPPKFNNRADLDIFDVAMVIAPSEATPTTFANGSAFLNVCANTDGYTAELATVEGAPTAACPYFLVVDESDDDNHKQPIHHGRRRRRIRHLFQNGWKIQSLYYLRIRCSSKESNIL
jgi:hypothetical protein